MSCRFCLVATTIGDGDFLDSYVKAIKEEELKDDVEIIVIPDLKTPPVLFDKCERLKKEGFKITCPFVEEQDTYLSDIGAIRDIIPYNSDNRRNIGYLMASEKGCDILISIDDDNYPINLKPFFGSHAVVGNNISLHAVESENGWFNVCRLLDIKPELTYPRGFPYSFRHKEKGIKFYQSEGIVHINAGLWVGHPDIDAVSCLYSPTRAAAFKGDSVLLGNKTWSPINTQNTALSGQAIQAYYFLKMGYPVMGLPIDRNGDIFSGYFVQACAKHLGYQIRFGTPIVDHRRNSHNYLKDLTYEIACIWLLEDVTAWLREVQLCGNTYGEAYLCLADLIEEQVEKFKGFIWNENSKGYFHYIAHCMRTWVKAIETFQNGRSVKNKNERLKVYS